MSQLIYNEDTKRYEMNGYGLHCGECFEVLIWNEETDAAEWIATRIEMGSKGWYLVGLANYQIDGLFAREEIRG